jgi:hypothetical protein
VGHADAFQLQASPSDETKACLARVAESAWDEARAACATATARDPEDSAAAAALARAEQELAQRAQRENDQSLSTARTQAESLLAQIDAFTQADVDAAKERVTKARETRSGVDTVTFYLSGVDGTASRSLDACKSVIRAFVTMRDAGC